MAIKYTFLSEKTAFKGTELQVCSSEGTNISVLQYKAEGRLLYSYDRGMYSEDKERQIEQIMELLRIADERGSDLVVTPEASVPWEIIDGIINGEIQGPEYKKLWCLGTEGIGKKDYKVRINKWSNQEKIVLVHPQNINWKSHVNTVFYFFRTYGGQLAVVLQAKTGAMRDRDFKHEQADLSCGEEIFILDLNGEEKAQNILATLICADILNINSVEFCSNFHERYPIILNIQMNPLPFYKKIIDFRKDFFTDNYIRESHMIVANWGRKTTIHIENEKTVENDSEERKDKNSDSGSTIYLSLESNHQDMDISEIFTHSRFIEEGIGKTQKSGLEYFCSDAYEVWKIQEDIQVACYEIKKGYRRKSGKDTMVRRYFPYIVHKYRYNEENHLEVDKELRCDCYEMKELLERLEKRVSTDIKTCANKECDECTRFYADVLVSLCLGEDVWEEYMITEGKSHRAVQTLFQSCKDSEKKEMMEKLVQGLNTIPFPERFGEFNDDHNFCFVVNYNAAKCGGNYKYNLESQGNTEKPRRILVIFLGQQEQAEVRKKYVEIRKKVHEDKKSDILLYYLNDGKICVYKEPYEQTSIAMHNNDFSQNTERII